VTPKTTSEQPDIWDKTTAQAALITVAMVMPGNCDLKLGMISLTAPSSTYECDGEEWFMILVIEDP
jgi:hypothetical protein